MDSVMEECWYVVADDDSLRKVYEWGMFCENAGAPHVPMTGIFIRQKSIFSQGGTLCYISVFRQKSIFSPRGPFATFQFFSKVHLFSKGDPLLHSSFSQKVHFLWTFSQPDTAHFAPQHNTSLTQSTPLRSWKTSSMFLKANCDEFF